MARAERAREAARLLGRLGGLKGGPARARKLSPEERKAQAKRASDAAACARTRRAQERRDSTDADEAAGGAPEAATA